MESPKGNRSDRRPAFDPYLGTVCAETWWDLGKLIAHRDDHQWIEKKIPMWTRELIPEQVPYITAESVKEFAAQILSLLRRRYRHEPIASIANALTAASRTPVENYYRDDDERGPYLDFSETFDQFWAIEYGHILDDMLRPDLGKGRGWLEAVDECHECKEFFVKQRRDQMFDKSSCRTRFANRDAYLSRRKRTRH